MIQKCSIWLVAAPFFHSPMKGWGLLELCRESKLAHTSVKNHLITLKQYGIISEYKEKKGGRSYPVYKAEQNAMRFRDYKVIYNLAELFESRLIDYIKDTIMPRSIILFGSYHKGEDIEDSDIDIFVEAEKADLNLLKFEKILKRRIQLHFKAKFKEYSKELKNNIINGTTLYGYLEAFE